MESKDNNKSGSYLPKWVESTLQGLAFWIGHRRALYHDHALPEGALVAEACNLLQANLESNKRLLCECAYKRLIAPGSSAVGLNRNARADLVIIDMEDRKKIKESSNLSELVRMVIEVKSGSAGKKKIEDDIA
ncbi:MAG: hypothetical protein WCI43_07920 [Candidatus Firestonebacteria bacterium]